MPEWPQGQATAFMNLEGVRDTAFGVLILALLLTHQRRALAIGMLATSLVPLGDMLTVLRYDGSPAAAFGIHGLTAALVIATGLLLLREHAAAHTPMIAATA
ncbi:DUF4267 domain-containing protein [Nocardia sp. CDC159]|uniref:DUF4267 domain-containing protein n=1 Tax=Nocardia pulmonis TaxID=2951408 RepID=A0A9X2IX81_9NOCA|nr:DUF4267 domain-containing protein [Nocardia pulmonis]MCM6775747.1 DUF4267 domain-containing protein [Nocardia pulmonis]MCM6788277.1 DUF4267 domain-containing protein [Nocardia sp. CDC159]